jgi:hypothetical protein
MNISLFLEKTTAILDVYLNKREQQSLSAVSKLVLVGPVRATSEHSIWLTELYVLHKDS